MCQGGRHVEVRRKSEHMKSMKSEMVGWASGKSLYLAEAV